MNLAQLPAEVWPLARWSALCAVLGGVGMLMACSGKISSSGAPEPEGPPLEAGPSADAALPDIVRDALPDELAADAAAPGDSSALRPKSGQAFCADDRDCESCDGNVCEVLACSAMTGAKSRACLRPCAGDPDCRNDELCLTDLLLRASCFPRCEWPFDCITGFDCVDRLGTGDYLCVPGEWAVKWGGALDAQN